MKFFLLLVVVVGIIWALFLLDSETQEADESPTETSELNANRQDEEETLLIQDPETQESDELPTETSESTNEQNEESQREISRIPPSLISSSKTAIVACPESKGIELFLDVATNESKNDADRTRVVDENNCSIVGKRDIVSLLKESKGNGRYGFAGEYTYDSEWSIFLVDVEQGEGRTPSARDIQDGRYWVINRVLNENTWEQGKEPPIEVKESVATESEPTSPPGRPVTVTGRLPACGTVQGMIFLVENLSDLAELPEQSATDIMARNNCVPLNEGDIIFFVDSADTYQYDDHEFVKLSIKDKWGREFERWMLPSSLMFFTDLLGDE